MTLNDNMQDKDHSNKILDSRVVGLYLEPRVR